MLRYISRCNPFIAPGAILSKSQYTALVEEVADAIAAGTLKAGERLPPQRIFAYEKGIAASTAGRVYSELLRRGLVVGEVGRGTFVAGRNLTPSIVRGVPQEGRIDLEFNFPTVPAQAELLAKSLAGLQRAAALADALGPLTQRRLTTARNVSASFLATAHWRPDPDSFVFSGSGRQSIAAAISAVVPVGGRLAVEAVTYPMIRSIAARLGVGIVPISTDAEGLRPDAIARAHRSGAISAVYVQPVLQNPLGHTMSPARRQELLRLAEKLNLVIIEDLVYGFLADEPPLAAQAPERCLAVDSLSKRLAPGVAVGFIVAPKPLQDRLATVVRAGTWSVTPLALDVAARAMADGTAAEIVRLKRIDAHERQRIVSTGLAGHQLAADPRTYHAWLTLPDHWSSDAFVAAAGRRGVAVTPGRAFAMTPTHAPNAVRLALGLPRHDELAVAVQRLRALVESHDEADVTE